MNPVSPSRTRVRPSISARALLVGSLVAMALPGVALADTLVYVKSGQVYVANPDGSQARPVSPQSDWWKWPSESDNGTIVVAGGAAGVNTGGSTETSGSSEIYAFDQQGKSLLSTPINTPGSVSSPSAPTYVGHFRVAPDASAVAYDVIGCCGASGQSTFKSPLSAGASWTQFMDDYVHPVWVEGTSLVHTSSAFGLTHVGATIGSQPEYAVFDSANSSNNLGWSADTTIPDGWAYEAALSRQVTKLAIFLDDAPVNNGTAQNVQISIETIDPGTNAVTPTCTINLPASQFSQPSDLAQASPSFSTDGALLAWGQADGIYEANLSDPTNCAAITGSVHLVVAGGQMPSFGAAALSAPVVGGSSGGGSASGPSGGGGGKSGGCSVAANASSAVLPLVLLALWSSRRRPARS